MAGHHNELAVCAPGLGIGQVLWSFGSCVMGITVLAAVGLIVLAMQRILGMTFYCLCKLVRLEGVSTRVGHGLAAAMVVARTDEQGDLNY